MPGMTVSEVEALATHVQRQGVNVLRTKNGYLFRLPNQDTCNVHFSSSDVNQKHQIRRALKRAGVTMPKESTSPTRKPTARSIKLVRDALVAIGDPNPVAVKDIMAQLAKDGNRVGNMTVSSVLVQAFGYAPSGSTSSRRFHRPLEKSLVIEEAPQPEVDTQTAPAPVKLVEPGPVEPHREFVDLVGSWMIDPTELPETLTIADARALLAKVGLGMEIRVWRLENGKPPQSHSGGQSPESPSGRP